MPAEILDGKAMARQMRRLIPEQVEAVKAKGVEPHLVSIQVGEEPASSIYVSNQKKSFEASGIRYTLRQFDPGTSEEDLLQLVKELNRDPTVTGVILQLPLPHGIHPSRLHSAIRPEKDVEGMNPANLGFLVQERPIIVPCTALAVYEMIRSCGVVLRGKEAVVVGHSPLVGKPISILLLNALATVTICHIATEDVAAKTRRADLLIVAAGKPGLIRGPMVRPGAVVIDVGINLVEMKEKGSGGETRRRSVGDVVFDEVRKVAGHLSPVPGGVGPVTVAVLLRNTLRSAAIAADVELPPFGP